MEQIVTRDKPNGGSAVLVQVPTRTMTLKFEQIRMDGATQPRAKIELEIVGEYAEAMLEGAVFPPAVVFYDGRNYWLADGFHRAEAAHQIGRDVECEVHQGTREDAEWYSCSANKTHGVRRTNEDKARAVKAALMHPKGVGLSDHQIANHVGVDAKTIGNWRERLAGEIPQSASRTGADGRTIDTTKIGRKPPTVRPTAQPTGPATAPPTEPASPSEATQMPMFGPATPPDQDREPNPAPILPEPAPLPATQAQAADHPDPESEVQITPPVIAGSKENTEAVPSGEKREKEEAPHCAYYLVRSWEKLAPEERTQLIADGVQTGTKPFRKQSSDSIDWAEWSWNPVTGCSHGCKYCYARGIANRFYEQKFKPSFYPECLAMPRITKVPASARSNIAARNVFVCSMADLFGAWVPQDWIEAVLDQVRRNPRWNFLFLTKNPNRLTEITWPDNAWVGATLDSQARVAPTEAAFRNVKAKVKWLSCEPLLGELKLTALDLFNWLVVGPQTNPDRQPEWRWVESVIAQARNAGCSVYVKSKLAVRPCEFPLVCK